MSAENIRKLVESAPPFVLDEENGGLHQAQNAPSLWLVPTPITAEELQNARATPDCIVERLLYADVGVLNAPGGVGKTTLILHIAVHIVLGVSLFGLRVLKPGPVLIVTAEDSREMLVARLRAIATAMRLNETEKTKMMQGILLSDVSGHGFRLTEIQNDVVKPSAGVDALIKGCQTLRPVLVVIDPAVSFGVGESRVNDAEQGLVEAARRLRRALECCVLYIHHSGKQNARDKAKDQYAGRGGSAFADGSRMVFVLQNVSASEWRTATGRDLEEGETGLVLARPKMSYCPPQDEILISRSGYRFEHSERVRTTQAMVLERVAEQIWQLLTDELRKRIYHSKNSLEHLDTGWSRANVRGAVSLLIASRKIELRDVPAINTAPRSRTTTCLHPIASPPEYGEHRSIIPYSK